MIYKKYLLLGVSLCMLNACNESKSVSLEGSLDGIQADSIYLYQVDNEHYGSVKLIKSIAVTDGRFAYPTDSIQAGLYCFSLQNMERGEYLQQYANLFLEPKSMQLTLGKDKYDQLSLHATGSALQEQYEALQEAKYIAGNRMVLDSLDHMFYEAREKGDREEMERIREVSSPYYESASEQTRKLINGEIAKNKGSYFGLYLYYTYRFQNHTFNTVEDHEGNTIIEADVPLLEIYGYSTVLRSMTGGSGDFSYEFARYEQAPSDIQEKEIAARASKVDSADE